MPVDDNGLAMPDLLLVKSFGRLEAADPDTVEYLKGLSVGELVKARVTKPRHGAFHRKVMSLLQLAYENQDQFDNFDDFRKSVTIEAGYYRDRKMFDGTIMLEAKSLSYAAMCELEFQKFFNDAFNVIVKFLGTDDATLNQEIQGYMVIGG